jgi:ABC-type phosphate transport system substrate-binding protein
MYCPMALVLYFDTMKKILTAFFLVFFAASTQAEIVVIGNLKNNIKLLNSIQVEAIFMGRLRSLPNGRFALPLDQLTLRSEFYQKLTSRPIEQINAYWTRIMFTGQASPPIILPDDIAVLTAVNENKDAIGYIDKKNVNNKVRILLILN